MIEEPRSVRLTESEASTYTIDCLEAEIREYIAYELSDYDEMDGPPPQAQIEWVEETAKRIAATWAMHRDGFIEDAIEDARGVESATSHGKEPRDG